MAAFDEKRTLGRIWLVMLGLGLAGTAGFLIRGSHAAVSFIAGAGISALSFWLLQRATRDLTRAAQGVAVRGPAAIVHVLRYGLIFGLTFAMLSVYGVDRTAFVCGLLTSVTAAFLEALFESFYA